MWYIRILIFPSYHIQKCAMGEEEGEQSQKHEFLFIISGLNMTHVYIPWTVPSMSVKAIICPMRLFRAYAP